MAMTRSGPTDWIARQLEARKQFIKFAGIGAIGTVVHWSVLVIGVSLMARDPVSSTTAGALAGALVNYSLNYRFTFASSARHRDALPRSLILVAAGIVSNGAIVAVLSRIGLHYLGAQLTATLIVLAINYAASKTWVFQSARN